MITLELKNDLLGKNILLFNNKSEEEKTIGDKIEDFEILMLLGKGSFGKVYKARSKLNKKIYAIKMVDLKKIENKDVLRLSLNEAEFLSKLSHPHIIKYYKNFEDKNEEKLYIITEFAKYGDLFEIMKIREETKNPFTEEELWNIFYQCISSLSYIHKKGVIHRDIKPKNIFLDENMTIKIGDFGSSALNPKIFEENNKDLKYSNGSFLFQDKDDKLLCHGTYVGTEYYMAPEMRNIANIKDNNIKKLIYDQMIDVSSMGKTFEQMAHSIVGDQDYKNLNYSNKIDEIINLMLRDDPNERITSEGAFLKIEAEYLKILKNSSIYSVMTCLSSFTDLNDPLKNGNIKYKDNSFIYNYINCIKYLHNKKENENSKKWEDMIINFRKQLFPEKFFFEGINEIEPIILFEFILKKIEEEMINLNPDYKFGPHLINENEENIIKNEVEAETLFNNYLKKYDSLIIKNFMGLMKQTNICNNCELKTYIFSSFFYATFDFEKISEKRNDANIDLEKTFKENIIFNNNLYCNKCLQKVEHNCNKEYYSFPNLLVIFIKRENKSINNLRINLKEILELKDLKKNKEGLRKYKLVGLIKKINKDKDEIYYSNFYYNNHWLIYEKNKKIIPCDPPFEKPKNEQKEEENIVMLFYSSN